MNFDYCRIGSRSSNTTPVTLPELATNIATDWMPRTPSSLSRGFVDLLTNILETKTINHNNLWTLRPEVGKFEKQWKQVTSWILGVALCRKVAEMEGYPYWAPVSAFTSRDPRWAPSTTNWHPSLPHHHCNIIKPRSNPSRLMPDYVLARTNPAGGNEISFAESKGTYVCLENMKDPPQPWMNQARNAEFSYRGHSISPSQQMLVATRVNPKATRPATRRVYVRAWNSKNKDNQVPIDAIIEIMFMHYFGVCERIGMDANAKLLALSTYSLTHLFPRSKRKLYAEILDNSQDKLSKIAKQEITQEKVRKLQEVPVFFASPRSDFIIGEKKIRIGLSEPAMRIVNLLQKGVEDSSHRDFIEYFQEEIKSLSILAKESPNIILRNDGVLSELIE